MFRKPSKRKNSTEQAQSAIEYMILLGLVVSVVMVGFRLYIPRVNVATCQYFNTVVDQLYGPPVDNAFLINNPGR